MANILNRYILAHKYATEKVVRESGLKYLIIRPTAFHDGETSTDFTLDQGDKIKGSITPATAAQISVDAILDHWVYPNTTFECTSGSHQLTQKYSYVKSQYGHLKPDTHEVTKKIIDHKFAVRFIKTLILLLSTALAYGSAKVVKNIFSRKVVNLLLVRKQLLH